MIAGAAGHDVDLADGADIVLAETEVLEIDLVVLDAGEDAPAQGLGLLHDLLEHEVLIAALLGGIDLPVHLADLLLDGLHQVVIALDAVPGEDGHLAVLHIAHLPGVADDGGDIAGQEVAAVAIAQDQGAVLAHGDELVGEVGAQDAQGIGPLDAAQDPAHGLQNVALVEILDELGHHLGVRLRGEGDAVGDEELLQLHVIFDDAVVDHGDLAVLADLGVGVHVAGGPVGGPAGVADAHGAVHGGPALDQIGQNLEPALGLAHGEGLVLLRIDGHAGGVITPILQPGQSVQQNGSGLLPANKAYDSTHILNFLLIWCFALQEDKRAAICASSFGLGRFVLRSPAYFTV